MVDEGGRRPQIPPSGPIVPVEFDIGPGHYGGHQFSPVLGHLYPSRLERRGFFPPPGEHPRLKPLSPIGGVHHTDEFLFLLRFEVAQEVTRRGSDLGARPSQFEEHVIKASIVPITVSGNEGNPFRIFRIDKDDELPRLSIGFDSVEQFLLDFPPTWPGAYDEDEFLAVPFSSEEH
jgi:hypothetical protein